MRRRVDKPTVRIPHQTLRELAAEWHRSLNDSADRMSDVLDNGRREIGQTFSAPEA